jgi:hypothetical protein
MSYEYAPLPAPHYIRLVEIVRTSLDPIQLSIKIINLDDNVQYKCLSYTWDGGKYDQVGEEWSTSHITVLLDHPPAAFANTWADLDRRNLYQPSGSCRAEQSGFTNVPNL